MSSGQKIIKYIAIAFGAFLTINIIWAIVMAFTAVFGITTGFQWLKEENGTSYQQLEDITTKFGDINEIDNIHIDVDISKLNIYQANEFKVEIKNASKKVETKNSRGTLYIQDKKTVHLFFRDEIVTEINIYLPTGKEFEDVDINTGAGKTYIESLKAEKLKLDVGAGDFEMNQIVASKSAKINGGAGRVSIDNSDLTNLDMDCGVGQTNIAGQIRGNSKIDCGVGETNLRLEGEKEDYTFDLNGGIGAIYIDGAKFGDTTIGSGNTKIKIDGGVGKVDVTFQK